MTQPYFLSFSFSPRKKPRVLKKTSTRSHSFAPLIPLRRSKREKRLVYANFTPREIDNTILNKSACLIEDSSEVSTILYYNHLLIFCIRNDLFINNCTLCY